MKIKTSKLLSPTLDWAVAKCEGGWGCQTLKTVKKNNFKSY